MKIAILDLGTNTFNLLIAEGNSNQFETLYQDKTPVKLGSSGFTKKIITPEAMDRGLKAIAMFLNEVQTMGVEQVYAFATSALRNARNSKDFIDQVKKEFSLDIEIISGTTEAELIHRGVKGAHVLTDKKALIMDIGGGSTEFIIADKNEAFWMHSFELGAAKLVELYNPENPLKPATEEKIMQYILDETKELHRKIKEYNVTTLIGSSGSFDSIVEMILADAKKDTELTALSHPIDLNEMKKIIEEMMASTMDERQNRNGLISMRVDFIVMSSLLIKSVLSKHAFQEIFQCAYSLKEGAVLKTFEEQK